MVAVTALSRFQTRYTAFNAVFRVARRSLVTGATLLLVPSCIVADPPEYRRATQTRPQLDVFKAVPSNQDFLVIYPMTTLININVPVRSEDAGDNLQAQFYLDFRVPVAEKALITQRILASTYDDTSRDVIYPWAPGTPSLGCHILTLVVAHENSFLGLDRTHLKPGAGSQDADIMNWWVNVVGSNDASPQDARSLNDCPEPTGALP